MECIKIYEKHLKYSNTAYLLSMPMQYVLADEAFNRLDFVASHIKFVNSQIF